MRLSLLFKKKKLVKKASQQQRCYTKRGEKGGQGMKSMTDAIVFGRFMISGLVCILLLDHL